MKAAVLALVALGCTLTAQDPRVEVNRLLVPAGLDRFPEQYVRALEAFLTAEGLYRNGDLASCLAVLDELWATDPPGTESWARLSSRIAGINLGSPPCYHALRMLSDAARWRLRDERDPNDPAVQQARLTVVLVGHSAGIEPRNAAELTAGSGHRVEHSLLEILRRDGHRMIHQSLWLLREYVGSMTDGRLVLNVDVLDLPELSVPVHALAGRSRLAGLAPGAMEEIWSAVPEATRGQTDWWWVVYPSHVPEHHADFTTTEFITGGMTVGPDGDAPCFLIDDRSLWRKPPHLGSGRYTDVERQAYMPQWLQHELFHHLFRSYPEFGLEREGHQWFDRERWPNDFEGRLEADYLHEALHKRLLARGVPPLHVALRYAAPPAELLSKLTVDSLLGAYEHQPVENDGHRGTIERDGDEVRAGVPVLRWRNRAGATWQLFCDLGRGLLRTGSDNPYHESNPTNGRVFRIILRTDEDGTYVAEPAGFRFRGRYYARKGR